MTIEELRGLLRFYLRCIEEEDLRRLRLRRSQLHTSFAAPWTGREPLFHAGSVQVYFETSLVSDKRLLTRGRAQAGETERFFYGFPILLDEEDMLTPLFFAEVEIEPGNTGFTMRLTGTEGIQANEHILRSYGLQAEEVLAARAEMAGEYGTFEARVRAISQYLGLDAPNLASPDIEPLPRSSGGQRVWVRCPIVFRSERSVYTMHLRDELQKLASSKHLLTAVHSTALGHILGLPAAELTPQDRGERPKRRGVPATAAQPAARVLEVLPLNEAQAEAARQGLQETLTVVTGPPGTGKSQVVVDLLAGCALAEQPVLFASKNSKAVDVVCRRVESFLGRNENWLLRVGSKEKTEECRDRILAQLEALGNTATIADRAPSTDSLAAVESDLDECRRLLANVGKVRSALAEATKLRRSTFSRVPVEWRDAVNLTDWTLSTGLVFRKLEERLVFLAGKGRGRLGWRLAKVLAGGLWHKRLRRNLVRALSSLPEKVRQECEAELAASGSSETSADVATRCRALADFLDAASSEDSLRHLLRQQPGVTELTERLRGIQEHRAALLQAKLRATWTARLRVQLPQVLHAARRYFESTLDWHWRKNGSDFTGVVSDLSRFLPCWVVTNLSARRVVQLRPGVFDLVVIDEASQCDFASAIPLLFRAKRALVIGDPRQLRHISTLRHEQEHDLATQSGVHSLLDRFSYTRRSLYDVAEGASLASNRLPIFLAEHYRSHPAIVEYSNQVFYSRRLVPRTRADSLASRIAPLRVGVFWHNIQGRVPVSAHSAYNQAEVEAVVALVSGWMTSNQRDSAGFDIGIVTPFRLQMEKLEEAIKRQPWWNDRERRVTVGTAHRYQGDERDVMVFSPVVAQGLRDHSRRWVAETEQLLNVAITRARAALHIVGDLGACKEAGGYLGSFAEYVSTMARVGHNAGTTEVYGPESEMQELLQRAGVWFLPQFREGHYKLDFLVVSPTGRHFDVEVDDASHLLPERIESDEIRDRYLESRGYTVVRVDTRLLRTNPDEVEAMLRRLA